MPDSIMFQEDNYVVLETNQPEQFLTKSELFEKLCHVLTTLPPENISPDLQRFNSVTERAQYLIDTSCELDTEPGQYLQWYAVRLEK